MEIYHLAGQEQMLKYSFHKPVIVVGENAAII